MGPRAATDGSSGTEPTVDPVPTTSATDVCFGDIDPTIQVAKANYSSACGIEYSDTSGLHRCEFVDDEGGWLCMGPRAATDN